LDVTPLMQLSKDNYGFEVLWYCGGAPLQGETTLPEMYASLNIQGTECAHCCPAVMLTRL
jgi:hypothetical protein